MMQEKNMEDKLQEINNKIHTLLIEYENYIKEDEDGGEPCALVVTYIKGTAWIKVLF